MKINLILDTEEKTISFLYNGYNIIKNTIYCIDDDFELIYNKLVEVLKNDDYNFENFESYLNK